MSALPAYASPASNEYQVWVDITNFGSVVPLWDQWNITSGWRVWPARPLLVRFRAAVDQFDHEMATQTWPGCQVPAPVNVDTASQSATEGPLAGANACAVDPGFLTGKA